MPETPSENRVHETLLQGCRSDGDPQNSQRSHQAVAHPKRAVQFMPFAALKGYYELVGQAEDLTVEEVDDAELLSRSPDPELPIWEDTVECSL